MITNKFRIPGLVFVENGTREVNIPKGMLLQSLLISGAYTDTVSSAATAAKTYGVPIKLISLIGDGGKVLHSWRPGDIAREAVIYEQASLADILSPPTATTAAAHTGTFDLELLFMEPFSNAGIATALPTWMYDNLVLRVDWGGHDEVYQGGAGAVTIESGQSIDVAGVGITEDFSKMGNPFEWAKRLGRALRSFKEVATADADANFTIDLPRTADIRSLVLVTEDSNGQPTNAVINKVSLLIDNTVSQYNQVNGRQLRANNAKVFGVSMPTGVYVLEFAEDQDISHILEATKMTALQLVLDVSGTDGTIRVAQKRIEAGKAA